MDSTMAAKSTSANLQHSSSILQQQPSAAAFSSGLQPPQLSTRQGDVPGGRRTEAMRLSKHILSVCGWCCKTRGCVCSLKILPLVFEGSLRRTHAKYEYDLRNKFSLHSDLPCLITGSSVVRIAQEEMPQQQQPFLHLSAN